MANKKSTNSNNNKLWVQIMCGILGGLMVLGTLVSVIVYLI